MIRDTLHAPRRYRLMCAYTPACASKYGSFPGHFPNIINVTSAVGGYSYPLADGTCPVCNVLRIRRPSMRLESPYPCRRHHHRHRHHRLRSLSTGSHANAAGSIPISTYGIALKSIVELRPSPQECSTSRGCETNHYCESTIDLAFLLDANKNRLPRPERKLSFTRV